VRKKRIFNLALELNFYHADCIHYIVLEREISPNENMIFTHYYLDYNMVVRLELEFSIKDDNNLGNPIKKYQLFPKYIIFCVFLFFPAKTDYLKQRITQLQINVDNSNGTLLQINTEKVQLASRAAVKFIVDMSLKKNSMK